jgi:hypothetical protein
MLSLPGSLFAVAPGVPAATLLLTMFIACGGATVVMVVTLTTIVLPNELRGLCMSVLMTAGVLLGIGFAPMTVSFISGVLGGPETIGKALALVCMTASIVAAVTFAFGNRYFPSRA